MRGAMSRGSKTLNTTRSLRGFTLIEAVASIGLVAIGIASAMGGLGAMAKTDRQMQEREIMQRLAVQKYDEIVSTNAIDTAELNGDFSDRSDDRYEWRAEVEPSGEENLEILTVTVKRLDTEEGPEATLDGLVYRPPVDTGGTTP